MISHDEHEPAVRQPRLLELVELARAQPLPPLRTSSDGIIAAVAQRRSARARTVVVGAVLCAAAAWLLWTRVVPSWTRVTAEAPIEQASRVVEGANAGGEATPREPEIPPKPRASETTPAPTAVAEPTVPDAAPSADAPSDPAAPDPTAVTAAAALAREAERAMAERRRDDAIVLLSTLVREHPRHPAAKAALFDLGRLFRDAGRTDEARCAYRMLERRWPDGPGSDEVGAVLGALGAGPTCRGLRPMPNSTGAR